MRTANILSPQFDKGFGPDNYNASLIISVGLGDYPHEHRAILGIYCEQKAGLRPNMADAKK